MNYTEKYHLPQWEETDRIMRTDFNDAMARIEVGLSDTVERDAEIEAKAEAAAVLPYAAGTYVGNGETVTITTGFRPRFVIITAQEPTLQGNIINNIALVGPKNFQFMVELKDSGFAVTQRTLNPGTSPTHPKLNTADKRYAYIAFR
ncbi:MAG: hypothetical protein HFF72_08460 [Oscillospiraceae bacterium]|jgi:hypothetical protein|nr:hypothetical protein [Oscillospiraceae bacterium]MCI8720190.1 hypothetical protein [Oscillospiraceae bacterium]MCI8941651.1 hypothetical protein [Oscillospiraceae bacterium]